MADTIVLDPHAPVPLYTQLYRILRLRILEGQYAEGDAIPSENVLRDEHGITRSTVRKAIALLVNEGLVRQFRGKGTLVSYAPISNSIWNFGGFTDYSRARGQRPVTSLLEQATEDGANGRVLKLVRARGIAVEDVTLFLNLDTSWLSLKRYPGLENFDFEKQSLYQVLRDHYGVSPARSELTLSVVAPSALTARVFGDGLNVPGFLCATGDVFSSADELVERTSVIYSPTLEMRVGTSWSAGNSLNAGGSQSPGA